MSWHFLQDQEGASSPPCCTDGEPLQPLRSKTMHAGFCSSGKLMESFLSSLCGMTSRPSTADRGEERSTSSPAASHAPTSVPQEKAQASKAKPAASGAKWRGLSMKFDPPTFTLRTAHSLFSEDLELSCVTLPKWGMMRDMELWARMTSPPLTGAKESGYWPTPTKDAAEPRNKRYEQGGTSLATAVKTWLTPCARSSTENPETFVRRNADRGEHCHGSLATQVKTWPTPTASEWKDPRPRRADDRTLSDEARKTWPTPTLGGKDRCGHIIAPRKDGKSRLDLLPRVIKEVGQLSASWVEWLMGWPVGWSDLAPMTAAHFENWKRLTIAGEWFQVDPAECVREDVSPDGEIIPRVSRGVKHRAARLKCIGNGQVPVCACVAFNILKDE